MLCKDDVTLPSYFYIDPILGTLFIPVAARIHPYLIVGIRIIQVNYLNGLFLQFQVTLSFFTIYNGTLYHYSDQQCDSQQYPLTLFWLTVWFTTISFNLILINSVIHNGIL